MSTNLGFLDVAFYSLLGCESKRLVAKEIDNIFEIIFSRPSRKTVINNFRRNIRQDANKMEVFRDIVLSKEFSAPKSKKFRRKNKVLDLDLLLGLKKYGVIREEKDVYGKSSAELFDNYFVPWFIEEVKSKGVSYIQSKSLPRSGHHYLINLLTHYFSDKMHYCERYKPQGCCRTIPCVKAFTLPGPYKFMFQKSHDFYLRDLKIKSMKYIIQHRSVISRSQSNFEFAINNPKSGWKDNKADFKKFCMQETVSTINFYRKWVDDEMIDKEIVLYEDLVNNTEEILRKIVLFVSSESIDEAAFERSLSYKKHKINTFNSPEGVRDPKTHRYYDMGFFKDLEHMIKEAFPNIHVPCYFI
jgi:hypothetical protein